jgi:hypothetical protein
MTCQQWADQAGPTVNLQPKQPPARKSRKVRPYADEICRLQADGYTCEEIRVALADAGVVVSRSTVQREAARALQRRPAMGPTPTPTDQTQTSAPATPPNDRSHIHPSLRLQAVDPRTARQAAEDFMKDQVTNPLLRTERTG